MRKFLFFIEIIVFFSFFSCQNNNRLTPTDYHQKIYKLYSSMDSMLILMVKDVYEKEATEKLLTDDYNQAVEMIRQNMDKLNSIKELSDDPGFLKSTKDFYITCDSVIKNNFRDVINIYSQGEWTDEKGAKVDNLMKEIYNKIVDKEEIVRNKENDFALKYGIILTEK